MKPKSSKNYSYLIKPSKNRNKSVIEVEKSRVIKIQDKSGILLILPEKFVYIFDGYMGWHVKSQGL